MGGHIDCFLDISSFYSYLAIKYLQKNRDILKTHDVTINFIPIFLGGVNVGSGNKPPWSLPAKAAYGQFDSARAKKYHGMEDIEVPNFFPPLTILPQRAMCYIKASYSNEKFEEAWLAIFHALWIPPQKNVCLPESLKEALAGTKLFSETEVEEIMKGATQQEWKDKLTNNTKDVLEKGAFGAPWMWVRNAEGKEEPFFGSDRFHFMWEFLGLPWVDIEVLPKGSDRKAKL
ncbi:putative glutathione S-transferase kappa 1 [Bisporella sp. PMI_857]|nr:putative glutathione S-transferase kappa 1 [Bisporella sp. PMI_857]